MYGIFLTCTINLYSLLSSHSLWLSQCAHQPGIVNLVPTISFELRCIVHSSLTLGDPKWAKFHWTSALLYDLGKLHNHSESQFIYFFIFTHCRKLLWGWNSLTCVNIPFSETTSSRFWNHLACNEGWRMDREQWAEPGGKKIIIKRCRYEWGRVIRLVYHLIASMYSMGEERPMTECKRMKACRRLEESWDQSSVLIFTCWLWIAIDLLQCLTSHSSKNCFLLQKACLD